MTENILNKEPYISFYQDVFTPEECDFVIDASEKLNLYERSTIYSTKLKRSVLADWRTSSSFEDIDGCFDEIKKKCYDVLKNKFLYIPNFSVDHFEKTQIQRYCVGEFVGSHLDCFNGYGNNITDNDKIATMIIYLNDNFEGGETHFDDLEIKSNPKKGSGLFFCYDYGSQLNQKTKHQGLPVTEGTKYIITCWIRKKPITNWVKK